MKRRGRLADSKLLHSSSCSTPFPPIELSFFGKGLLHASIFFLSVASLFYFFKTVSRQVSLTMQVSFILPNSKPSSVVIINLLDSDGRHSPYSSLLLYLITFRIRKAPSPFHRPSFAPLRTILALIADFFSSWQRLCSKLFCSQNLYLEYLPGLFCPEIEIFLLAPGLFMNGENKDAHERGSVERSGLFSMSFSW